MNNTNGNKQPVTDKQEAIKKLRRRIEDYLRKYADEKQLESVASLLGIAPIKA